MNRVKGKGKKTVIGVWGYYEEQYYNNKIFVTPDAGIGDNLLKPMNDLYKVGRANNVEFVALDLIDDPDEIDAYIFYDFPRRENPLVKSALASDKPKYLFIFETPMLKPDNWSPENQKLFTKIFTCRDDLIDNKKFFKIYYSFDLPGSINKDLALKQKLCVVIAGGKMARHELSLYPARIEAIRWFEKNHPEDFDLFGMGWNQKDFPSYKGPVKSKKQILQKYKFSICYENTKDIPGYITEKMFDCFFAGCVPIYWGANNVTSHIPETCFIDKRKFATYEGLYTFLTQMDDATYVRHLTEIEAFLRSEKAYPFSARHAIETTLRECASVYAPVFPAATEAAPETHSLRMSVENTGRGHVRGLASISVMAFNKLEYTKQCVESILAHTTRPYELLLFDNGSTDGTFEYFESIKKIHSDTVVIRNHGNRIVEENINYTISLARGEYYVGISNDNIVHDGWLDNYIRQIEAAPDIGIVGPRSNNISGPQLVRVDYKTIEEYHKFAADWCKQHARNAFEVNRMVGMSSILKKKTLERIGGYDPELPTNGRDGGYGFSDDEFSLRLKIAGYKLVVANDVFIHHFGSVTVREYREDLFGPFQNINKTKYLFKLQSNPRVALSQTGEIRISPYTIEEDFPVPERIAIHFPRILVALFGNDNTEMTCDAFKDISGPYPLEIQRISQNGLSLFLKNVGACREYEVVVFVNTRLTRDVPAIKNLIAAALCNLDVAVLVPLGDYAPSTHTRDGGTANGVDIIPFADMSVCAVRPKLIRNCLEGVLPSRDDADNLWFLQRRVRGEGYHIARTNDVIINTGSSIKNHPYDTCLLPETITDLDKAAACYRDDVRRDPKFFESIFQLGRIALQKNRSDEALLDFGRVLELEPDHVPALIELARIFLKRNDIQIAERLITLADMKQPWNPEVRSVVELYATRKGITGPHAQKPFESRKPVEKGLVSIIIAGTQPQEHLKKCIERITEHTPLPYELLLLNTGWSGSTLKWANRLAKDNPHCKLIQGDQDASFAKVCNRGIRESAGEYLLILDTTAAVTENWETGMLACLHSAPDIGIVGPMTNSADGPQKVPTAAPASHDDLTQYAAAFYQRHRHRRIPQRRVDGFCMLFARKLADDIGLFDDALNTSRIAVDDFCLRAELLGYRNVIAGDVFIPHAPGKSASPPLSMNSALVTGKWAGIGVDTPLCKKIQSMQTKDKALELHHKGQFMKAVEALFEQIGRTPEERGLSYLAAELLIEAKQFGEALKILTEMLPDDLDAHKLILMGYCEEGLGHDEKAVEYADRVLALGAFTAMALNLKGLAAYKKGDRQTAEAFCKQAREADPGYGEPYTNLGTLRWAEDKKEEALELLERGFVLSPTVPDIIAAYHAAITDLREYGRAEQAFEEAHTLYPQNQKIAFLLIDVLLTQGKYDRAMQEIEQAMLLFGIDDGILAAALDVRSKLGPMSIDATSKKRGTVSLCMIVKNEEQHLPKCLMSVKPVVDEIIVVDTGSTDRTKDIARAFGAQVFDVAWTNDFSAARNVSLEKASGDWVLVLDADEVISPLDHPELLRLTAKQTKKAYAFTTRNYMVPVHLTGWTAHDRKYIAEEAGTGWHPSVKVRLFPRDDRIRFVNPVHEFVEQSLRELGISIKECGIVVHHYGKLSTEKVLSKGAEYYQLGRKKLDETGGDANALCELAIQAAELNKLDEALELWKRVLQIQPHIVTAHLNLGSLYLETGRYDDALKASRKAVELAPRMKEAIYNNALAELYTGNISRTLSLLEDLTEKEPDYPPAKAMLAMASCCDPSKKKRGLDLLKNLKQTAASLAESLQSMAQKLMAAKQYSSAVSLLDAAIQTGIIRKKQYLDMLDHGLTHSPLADDLLAAALDARSKIGPMRIGPAAATKGTLSLCMIVKNEEQHLPKCLMSVKPVVDEIIVVDTGSTDRTKDIARAFGAQVFDVPWTNDFSAARNVSLEKASGDWVLVLDADEVISPLDHPELLRLTVKQTKKAYAFTTRNYAALIDTTGWVANDGTYPAEEAGSGWFGSTKVRLFPRDDRIRFVNPVHELVEPSLHRLGVDVTDSRVPIHHYGKLDKEKALAKGEEYYHLGRKKLEETGADAHALRELAIQAGMLKKFDEAVDLWQQAIIHGTDKELAYLNLASLYVRTDDYDKALAAAQKAVEDTPQLRESTTNYALCELYTGHADAAIIALENLFKKDPHYPAAAIIRGIAYFCAGKMEQGKALFASLGMKGPALADAVAPFVNKLIRAEQIEYATSLLDGLEESNAGGSTVAELRAECARRAPGISPGTP